MCTLGKFTLCLCFWHNVSNTTLASFVNEKSQCFKNIFRFKVGKTDEWNFRAEFINVLVLKIRCFLMSEVSAQVLGWTIERKLLSVSVQCTTSSLTRFYFCSWVWCCRGKKKKVKSSRSLCLCFWELPALDAPTLLLFFWLLRDLSNNRLVAIPPNLFVLLGDLLQLWVLFATAYRGFSLRGDAGLSESRRKAVANMATNKQIFSFQNLASNLERGIAHATCFQ